MAPLTACGAAAAIAPTDTDAEERALRKLRIGPLQLDLHARALTDAQGGRVELRPQALELLCLLGEQPGQVVTKRVLMDHLWPDAVVTDDSLVQAEYWPRTRS